MNIVKRLLWLMWAFLIAGPLGVNALTLKSGEVLSPDGNVYTGASPEQQERLVEKAKCGGDMGGVVGNNVYIIADDKVIYVPTKDLAGKTK